MQTPDLYKIKKSEIKHDSQNGSYLLVIHWEMCPQGFCDFHRFIFIKCKYLESMAVYEF